MKLSTILSFTALSATASLAFPLSPFRGLRARADLEERDVYAPAPVRRSDVASSAEPTATESSSAVESTATERGSETASETVTSSAREATSTASESSSSSSDDSTNTWLYSTITQSGSMTTPPASTRTLDPTTETASTTTETDAPRSTSSDVSRNNGNNNDENNRNNNNNDNNRNNNNDQQIIIRIKEVIRIREVVVVERPVLVAVQVNIKVRQTIIVNQIRNVFVNRFDNWDQNVVDQLGLIISQQFDILTRSRNSGFDNLSNDQYNRFVSKFISQFEVFQSFQLVDVQRFVTVLKGFGVNELATFFGRSDSLFSQDTFNRFNVNNDFKVFVQQLTVIVQSVSVNSFNSDDLFGLGSGSLIVAGSIEV